MIYPVSGKADTKEEKEEAELDPRANIALARVNWLHSRYKIVCKLSTSFSKIAEL
jgi:hypothetical protein